MQTRGWLKGLLDRRRGSRIPAEGLAVSYWTGGLPKPVPVREISQCGAYILSPDVFYPGTMLQLGFENHANGSTIRLLAQVRRHTSDGFCVSFIIGDYREKKHLLVFLKSVKPRVPSAAAMPRLEEATSAERRPPDPAIGDQVSDTEQPDVQTREPSLASAEEDRRGEEESSLLQADQMVDSKRVSKSKNIRTMGSGGDTSGQALIELALILPLLFLLIVNVINFGGLLYAWITVSNAARTGAQYYITGAATLGAPSRPSAAAVQTLVMNDVYALRNASTSQVCVSSSLSTTVSCNTGTAPASAPPAAETAEGTPPVTFAVAAVDVTYTYQPFIPLWDFTRLNIHATLTATSVHRQAVMRILQ